MTLYTPHTPNIIPSSFPPPDFSISRFPYQRRNILPHTFMLLPPIMNCSSVCQSARSEEFNKSLALGNAHRNEPTLAHTFVASNDSHFVAVERRVIHVLDIQFTVAIKGTKWSNITLQSELMLFLLYINRGVIKKYK